MGKKLKKEEQDSSEKKYGNPEYGEKDDIYSRSKKEEFLEDEDLKEKKPNDKNPGDRLDVPGSELDDADEEIGEEDEENNYYSLGGDNHEDLEEDQGD